MLEFGNAKFYGDFFDEMLNYGLRVVVQHAHRLTMEKRVFMMFELQGSEVGGYIFGSGSSGG